MRIFFQVFLGCSILVFIIFNADIQILVDRFKDVNISWLGLSIIAITLSTLIGAINLYLFYPDHKIHYFDFLKIYWCAWAVGLVMPGQVGDLIGFAAMLKRRGIDVSLSLGRSLVDKLISLAMLGLFALLGLSLIYEKLKPNFSIPSYDTITEVSIAFLFISFFIKRWFPRHWISLFFGFANEFLFVIKNHRGRVCVNFILSFFKVMCIAVAYWTVFQSMETNINLFYVLCLMAISSIIAYLPISFNGIGTAELTGVMTFSVFSISQEEVLSTYLLLRIIVIVLAWLPAAIFLLFPSAKEKIYKTLG